MSVTEIEAAISQLSQQDFTELANWIQEYRERAWDEQIGRDLAAGRLDAVIAEAETEYRQGFARPL